MRIRCIGDSLVIANRLRSKESRILSRAAIRPLRLLPALILSVAACGGGSSFPAGGWSTAGTSDAAPAVAPSAIAVAIEPAAASPSSPTAAPPISRGSMPTPLANRRPSQRPVSRKATVPILYYHRIQPVPQVFSKWTKARQKHFLQYDALPKAFVAQLDWLVADGYTTILPGDLAAHWDHGTPLPPKPVIITFDDGSTVVDQTGDAGAPEARHGRGVLSHPRRDQG